MIDALSDAEPNVPPSVILLRGTKSFFEAIGEHYFPFGLTDLAPVFRIP